LDIKIIQDAKKGITVAALQWAPDMLDDICRRGGKEAKYLLEFLDLRLAGKLNINRDSFLTSGLRGVSKVEPRDEFDGNIGRRVAKAKLSRKYHRRMVNDYEKTIVFLEAALKDLRDFQSYHEKAIERENRELEKFM